MSKTQVKFVTNPAGIYALLKSQPVAEYVTEFGRSTAERAGKHFAYATGHTSQRSKVTVRPADIAGIIINSKDNTLLKALGK